MKYNCVCMLSRVPLFATPRTVASQAPQSLGSARQEYWSGLSFPPPEDLPGPGIEPIPPVSTTLARGFLHHWATWEIIEITFIWKVRFSEGMVSDLSLERALPRWWWVRSSAAKLLRLYPTLCNPIDGSPPGSPVPGILQTRTLEWVAISFSNEWKWKVKVKSLSCVRLLGTPWTAAYQAPPSMGFSRQEYWSGGAIVFSGKVIYFTPTPQLLCDEFISKQSGASLTCFIFIHLIIWVIFQIPRK